MISNQAKTSVRELGRQVASGIGSFECIGPTGAAAAYLLSKLALFSDRPLLIVTSTLKTAETMADDLGFFMSRGRPAPLVFPPYNISPFKFMSYHNETAAKRISVLYHLISGDRGTIVVAPAEALLQRVIPRKALVDRAELVMAGERCDRDRLIQRLVSGGYNRCVVVEEPGDLSVRGGILDVYAPLYDNPLRIEFFGDMVETIRHFSPVNQRRIESLSEAILLPAREAVLTHGEQAAIINRIRQAAAEMDISQAQIRGVVEQIKTDGGFPGAESLLPLIYPELNTFFDYVSGKALFCLVDSEEIEKQTGAFEERIAASYREAENEGRLRVKPERLYLDKGQFRAALEARNHLRFQAFPVSGRPPSRSTPAAVYHFAVEDNHGIQAVLNQPGRKEAFFAPLAEWIRDAAPGGAALLVCSSKSRAERLRSILAPYGFQLGICDAFPLREMEPGRLVLVLGQISEGFRWPEEGLAIITEEEIFGARRSHRAAALPKTPPAELIAVEDLKAGDIVVHAEHGIGRYEGLLKLELDGTTGDFLSIGYRDEDRLYLPVDRMNMVQKYLGVEGVVPALDKMGGKSWSRVKARVKRSAEKIAGELLQLYAARKVAGGHSFRVFEDELQEFEAGFSYEETADQLNAINEVLSDMARAAPMDRLVCGDVGYGKTEVALRAAFVAVYNGKQVAVLVPTTVLAEQHTATFLDRFKRFPVRIAGLSRFRSQGEQKAIVKEIREGKIDIVIGTHRLLSKDVVFKDLGLLVLDEEQRFGVKHKERLKSLRKNVDVLTLTATPIPRTLHMSLMGVRDISVISTPPEYRHAIVTYISEFDDTVVAEAVRRELQRRGQIFFIHNNIQSIEKMARKLKALVPEVRLDIAHGRLSEEDLEQVMLRFFRREIDMLVSTTIVESGLDVATANTMLVNRADKFGLAQMYQLRGRVGRADEQAYAYLFIPNASSLNKDARKRLKVLMEHSDLGAGFQIAMSDLQIRGGGTILGASQSGHIAAVGYEMFLELMEHAVSELKGEPLREALIPEINLPLSAFIPETYIPDIDQRLSAYRRLARMSQVREINAFKEELLDRFGAVPEDVNHLLLKIALKVFAVRAGVKRLDLSGPLLTLAFSEEHQANPQGLIDLILENPNRWSLTPDQVLKIRLAGRSVLAQLGQAKKVLKEIAMRVNN
jgi:transcription-repair coupling factor (superfamily II helicase)